MKSYIVPSIQERSYTRCSSISRVIEDGEEL